MNDHPTVISVDHLVKSYGSQRAVDDISFQVKAGEIFGILGPNGAGKTTTIELLAGLRKPDSGTAQVLGLDPQNQAKELYQRTGIQMQQAALPDALKVWEALDLFASFYRRKRDWHPLIEEWGLAEKRNTAFSALSGGQRQRLFIALALVNDPDLVFLDELTSGLDPQARHTTWDLIRQIRDRGKTVILVTHFMDEAEKLCDRVAIVDHGRLIALDQPQQLIQGLKAEACVRFTNTNGFNPASLSGIPGVTRAAREGQEIVVYGKNNRGGGSLLLQVAACLGDLGLAPTDLRMEQASLEDVFLEKTGRAIRD